MKVIMTQGSILSNLLGLVRAAYRNRVQGYVKSGYSKRQYIESSRIKRRVGLSSGLSLAGLLWVAAPAFAHHPFGGQTPQTLLAGFLSGLGHPVVGIDHLAFVIAVGLLSAVVVNGWTIVSAFLLTALMGTGIHLMSGNLPTPEIVISASVLLFGLLALTRQSFTCQSLTRQSLNAPAVVALTGLAGMFHGYAYGEAIVGAQPTPLVAYLVGFTLVQGLIAIAASALCQRIVSQRRRFGLLLIRLVGCVICGVGAALLAGAALA